MMVIEHVSGPDLEEYFKPKGYSLFKVQHPDYIFVRNEHVKLVKDNPYPNNKRKRYWRKNKNR